jgi:hypothetical protein
VVVEHDMGPVPPWSAGLRADDMARWLLERLLLAERHETCEFLWVGDERPFYPDHGPTVPMPGGKAVVADPYAIRQVPLEAWLVTAEQTSVTEAYLLAETEQDARELLGELFGGSYGDGFHWDTTDTTYDASEVDPAKHPRENFYHDGRDVPGAKVAELLAELVDPRAPGPGQLDIFGGVVA